MHIVEVDDGHLRIFGFDVNVICPKIDVGQVSCNRIATGIAAIEGYLFQIADSSKQLLFYMNQVVWRNHPQIFKIIDPYHKGRNNVPPVNSSSMMFTAGHYFINMILPLNNIVCETHSGKTILNRIRVKLVNPLENIETCKVTVREKEYRRQITVYSLGGKHVTHLSNRCEFFIGFDKYDIVVSHIVGYVIVWYNLHIKTGRFLQGIFSQAIKGDL
ncbi:hypothetical protein SDC9_164065 [bioreactor metagenome]|uniref:Uncharacterized protein n=1 Tax=bioreactor metagenome TaxID=1076179 RepID=A0A645FS53_9ZZZZ